MPSCFVNRRDARHAELMFLIHDKINYLFVYHSL